MLHEIQAFHQDHFQEPQPNCRSHVDLAWHTHQLSPLSYYHFTTRKLFKFVRHDDKIEDDKLNDGFEYTSKVYQELYDEVYSECTCWYCEATRAAHVSSAGRILKLSHNEKSKFSYPFSGLLLTIL